MELSNPAVKLIDLTKDFKKLRAVDSLNLEITEGEIFALVGPNGAGKTTTIKMILGIIQPTSGQVQVLGWNIPKERQKIKRDVGYLAQQRALYDSLTTRENIEFFAAIKGMDKIAMKNKTDELLQVLDLTAYEKVRAHNLSGGTQQRVALACACVNSPRLLLLDEATVGLDPVLRKDVWEYLRKFNKEVKGAIIITTHFLDEADYADRVGFMRGASLIALDSPEALKKHTSSITMEEVFLKLAKEEA
ncbi:MAG: ABC transporter ATP-binding protein [Candidatus Heimdallarchaeota archaeon]|nr:ABC transporter ATP-binding protein [Candidatus Heimdallarchaeota archaeon]